MSHDIVIGRLNDVHIMVSSDNGIAQELSEYFSFKVPGAQFIPSVRNKIWDGVIRLFNTMNRTLYAGLLPYVIKFANDRGYTIRVADDAIPTQEISETDVVEFLQTLNLPHVPRAYQLKALVQALRARRNVLISPTASGKSLIIYMIAMWRMQVEGEKNILIVVPTKGLVNQMRGDFIEYGCDPDIIQIIMGGESKQKSRHIVISTWQSIAKLPKKWFADYKTIIGDEAHTFKAKSLTSIMEKLVDCPMRIGTTGTLDGAQVNKLVLEGLFGQVFQVEKTHNLMKNDQVAKLKIRCVVVQYTDEEKKLCAKAKYDEEVDWIVRHPRRLKFVRDFALSLEGNTLVLFQYVEKHGIPLYKALTEAAPDRKIYLVHGGTSADDREAVRKIAEASDDAIIVASYGTFSTGINIKKLHNAVAASPTKSMIRLLQSIGRILRLSSDKSEAFWYDIADDLTWKSHVNFTMKHFAERIKIYSAEKFDFKIFKRKI